MLIQLFLVTGLMLLPMEMNPEGTYAENDKVPGGGWQLERNTSGVKSYVRWIEPEGTAKVRERMGTMEIACSADDVISLLSDFRRTSLWMSGIRENYCLQQVSITEWYAYTLFDIPWPFEKRDLVSNFKVRRPEKTNLIVIHISSSDEYIPEKDNITRLTDYAADWKITPAGDHKVYVTFSAVANTPPMFPRYIQDPVLARMFHNNLVNLKELLEEGT